MWVYRADGAVASGTVLIWWSAFTTADEKAVAAGSLIVELESGKEANPLTSSGQDRRHSKRAA